METMSTSSSTSSPKCKDIKAAYQQQNCCKNPMGNFTVPMQRRLLDRSGDDETDNAYNEILSQMEAGMVHMRNIGGAAKTEMLARAVAELLAPYAKTDDVVI